MPGFRSLAVVALAALFVAGASFAQEKKFEARPLSVGVVDVGTVFKNYKRKEELEKLINKKKDGFEARAREQSELTQRLRQELGALEEGSEPWIAKRTELKLEIKKAEVLRESWDEELKRETERLTLIVLDEIEGTVRDYGKKGGFDFILKTDTKGWADERFQERIFRAQVAPIMYFDRKLDLTKQVLDVLNDPELLKTREFR